MHLPEKEAFRKAKELAKEHEWKTSVGRFMDFQRYYPLRKGADKTVREAFTRLGGHPRLAHPYHFVLLECSYLHEWYDNEESLRIPLEEIPEDRISFTLGDSCAKFLAKGKKVCVIGEPRVHAWSQEGGQARGQMEMNADEVEFLNSGSGNTAPTDADVPQAGQETEERPY